MKSKGVAASLAGAIGAVAASFLVPYCWSNDAKQSAVAQANAIVIALHSHPELATARVRVLSDSEGKEFRVRVSLPWSNAEARSDGRFSTMEEIRKANSKPFSVEVLYLESLKNAVPKRPSDTPEK